MSTNGKTFSQLATKEVTKLDVKCGRCQGQDFRYVVSDVWICAVCHGVITHGVPPS